MLDVGTTTHVARVIQATSTFGEYLIDDSSTQAGDAIDALEPKRTLNVQVKNHCSCFLILPQALVYVALSIPQTMKPEPSVVQRRDVEDNF